VDNSHRQSWVPAAILLGVLYCLIGVAFALPADHVLAWRRAAWGVSAAAYAAHVAYEHFKLRSAPRSGALHVALAVALGAFGLAAAANIHSLSVASPSHHRRLLLALGVWPVVTALPAFLAALVASWVLARLPRGNPAK